MTFPKGSPKEMTSPSVTSLGSLRMWITLEGTPALRLSPLNFLLSFPFAEKRSGWYGTGHPRLPHKVPTPNTNSDHSLGCKSFIKNLSMSYFGYSKTPSDF